MPFGEMGYYERLEYQKAELDKANKRALVASTATTVVSSVLIASSGIFGPVGNNYPVLQLAAVVAPVALSAAAAGVSAKNFDTGYDSSTLFMDNAFFGACVSCLELLVGTGVVLGAVALAVTKSGAAAACSLGLISVPSVGAALKNEAKKLPTLWGGAREILQRCKSVRPTKKLLLENPGLARK